MNLSHESLAAEFNRYKEKLLQIKIIITGINIFDTSQVQEFDKELKQNNNELAFINLTNVWMPQYDKDQSLARTLAELKATVNKPIILCSAYHPVDRFSFLTALPHTIYFICPPTEFMKELKARHRGKLDMSSTVTPIVGLFVKQTVSSDAEKQLLCEIFSGGLQHCKYITCNRVIESAIEEYEKSRNHFYRTKMALVRNELVIQIKDAMSQMKENFDPEIYIGLLIAMRNKAIQDHIPLRIFGRNITSSGFVRALDNIIKLACPIKDSYDVYLKKYQDFIDARGKRLITISAPLIKIDLAVIKNFY